MLKILKPLFRSKSFAVKSEGLSMLPILHSNDMVYYKKIQFRQVKINDIILVLKKKGLFTHRVIYKTDIYLVTKGDNNPQSDGKIYPHQIIGKVVKVKRNGKEFDPNQIYLLQSSLYFQEIIKIKEVFEKEKIDFVFLKGLPLHLYFEKTHPQRFYLDCDVLVDKKDFLKAEKVLLKNGYKKADTSLTSTQKKLKDKEVENAYFKVINGFSVIFDLHLEVVFMMTQLGRLEALYQQKLIDQLTEEFLKTKGKIKINGQTFFILNIYYLILYLAIHFFHHNFRGAFRLKFLDKVIRQSHLKDNNWREIKIKINEFSLGNFVSPVFLLLKKYYLTPIPDFINFKNFTNFKNLSIFDDEPRIGAGINRFKNLFFLSPRPLFVKVLIIFNPQVLYSIFWILRKRLFSFFSNRQLVH